MAQRKKDAAFIAHARADIPALTAALEASENARLKAEKKFAQIGRDGDPQSCLDADGVPVEKARLRGEWIDQRDRITALE
ncbi:hypothetical protein GM547_14230, partial [Streptococcus pneumoniae]|uniref:hypothetical protein n=1 Tax=Streptococcus pneumoniae TaxID=1313 RepID=UPI0012D7F831